MKSKLINITWLEYKGIIKEKPYESDIYNIAHINPIKVDQYKEIYKRVGSQYSWLGRSIMKDDDLKKIIANKKVEIYFIKKGSQSIGFFEIDYSSNYLKDKELRIVHFGLIREYIGKGLGIKLMNAAVTRAYYLNIDKIILQTNSLDHKRALPFYKKYGFEIFSEETKNILHKVS